MNGAEGDRAAAPTPLRPVWPVILGLTAAMVLVAPWDQAISEWARAEPRAKQLNLGIEKILALGPLLTPLVLIGAFPNWRRAIPAFLLSVVSAGAITQGLKWLVGRARPDFATPPPGGFDTEHWLSWAGELQSFPSGDATAAAAIATAFGLMLPGWRWLFVLFTLGVMLERVANARHFPSDTIAGATVGVVATLTCMYWFGRNALRLDRRDEPEAARSVKLLIVWGLTGAVATALAYPFDPSMSGALSQPQTREAINGTLDALGPLMAGLTLVALARELRPRNWTRPLATVACAILLTVAATHALKFAVGRARPLADPGTVASQPVEQQAFTFNPLSGRKHWDSFPSGHTSHVVSIALALGRFFPHGRAYYFLMAAVVAVERIPTGWHYVSDLLAGAIVAVVCFRLVDRWFGEPAPRQLHEPPDA